jgi:Na+/melibiose symporter-like transporter
LIPAIAIILGAAILFFFPIKGERLVELKEKIILTHAEKKAGLERIERPDQAA